MLNKEKIKLSKEEKKTCNKMVCKKNLLQEKNVKKNVLWEK